MSKNFSEDEVEMLREYAELKIEGRKIEKRIEQIKDATKDLLVREDAVDNPVVISGLGKLTLRPRKIWVWSDETKTLEESLKQAKETDKATGRATFEEAHDVFFTDK